MCSVCRKIHLHQPPKERINSHTWKFHITVLFNIQENGWIIFLVQLLPKIFSFANVISSQKNHGNTLIHKVCNTRLFTADGTGIKLFV